MRAGILSARIVAPLAALLSPLTSPSLTQLRPADSEVVKMADREMRDAKEFVRRLNVVSTQGKGDEVAGFSWELMLRFVQGLM